MKSKIFLVAVASFLAVVSIFSNPVISNVQVKAVYGTSAVIIWTTDVPSTSMVTYGASTPPTSTEQSTLNVTKHSMTITGLSTCTPYYFSVTSADGSGSTTDNNNGNYYTFATGLDTEVTYNMTGGSVEIPLGATVQSTITATDTRKISDMKVTIGSIDVANASRYFIYFIAPDNRKIPLSLWNDASHMGNNNYVGTVFYDGAELYITDSSITAPYTGTFKPQGKLSYFKGMSAAGDWKLEIQDQNYYPNTVGYLNSWSITFLLDYEYCEPHLKIQSYEINDVCTGTGNGNNDNIIDAGEEISLPITLYNDGNSNLTSISATLTTSTSGVTITNGTSSFPNINKNGSGVSQTDFKFLVDVSKQCGDNISFNLHISSYEKPSGWDIPLSFTVGDVPPDSWVLLDEDFSFYIPSTWTIVDGGDNTGAGPAATWNAEHFSPVRRYPPLVEPYALMDSDFAGPDAYQDDSLITPVLDCSRAATVTLEYDNEFWYYPYNDADGYEEKGDVDIKSSLTNEEWVNIKRYEFVSVPEDPATEPAVHEMLDISQYAAGASDVQIRYHYYNANWDTEWVIDNVKVTATGAEVCDMNRCCPQMSEPVISDITDNDKCSQSGITITFTSSTPATRHDFYVDDVLKQSNVTSPISYNPGDTNSHSYKIKAINYYEDCYIESSAVSFTDEALTPPQPSAPTVQDLYPCDTSGVSISWSSVQYATNYDLLVDGTTIVQNVTSPYTYQSGDNSSHSYQIRGRNVHTNPDYTCTGEWSTATSGVDENHSPQTPTSAPTVSDKDACQTNGVNITWTAINGATHYDLRVDGTTIISNVTSPYTYQPGDNSSHFYEIRGKYVHTNPDYTCYGGWSPSQSGVDINDTPGQPVITSITDVDECATSGVTITYTAGSGATSHDLYKDGSLAQSNFISGSTYQPGDNVSHTYVIRAKKNTCYTNSTGVSGTDVNNKPGQPVIVSITDVNSCATSGVTITYTAGSGATSHDLYKDGSLAQSNFVSGSTYQPGDNASHTYVIRAKKSSCYTDSTGVSATDYNDTPGEPMITGVTDNDLCATTGIAITYNAGSGATSHDLYKDGSLAQSNFVSGSTYQPGDNAFHTYVIRAKKNACYTDSSGVSAQDQNQKPGTPNAPFVADLNGCATSGVQISWDAVSQATTYDLLVDGTNVVSNVSSPYTYYPNDNSSHTYQVRGRNSTCTGDWSNSTSQIDLNLFPATPEITVVDASLCALTGVTISWNNVANATDYDLRIDGSTIISNVTSPYNYTPPDSNSHTYEVRGKNISCTGDWSTSKSESDINDMPDIPTITSITDVDPCATSGVSISFTSISNATGYDLRVDGTTVVSDITNPYTYVPSDNNSHTYQVRAKNLNCASDWSISTSYANTGGSGNRTSIITVTSSTMLGTLSQLVDGNITSSGVYFDGSSVVGKYVAFNFGSTSYVINEAKYYQGTSATQGTWKWQGSNDGSTWVDIGTPFVLGGATTQAIDVLKNNTTAYKNYRIYGVSGNSSSGPYVYEFEFKINSVVTGVSAIDGNDTPGQPTITSITDVNSCATSGVTITYTAGSGATSHDLYKDGSLAQSNFVSGSTYQPGDNVSHTYVIRAKKSSCYTDSDGVSATDVNDSVGAPVITSIVDNNPCAQDGIRIYYTPGSGANIHSLWKDSVQVVSNYSSGALYNPGDTSSHSYVIRAEKGVCYNVSSPQNFADANNTPGAPTITAVNDVDTCAQSGVQIVYTAGSGATSHDLYKDGTKVVTGYTSGATYNPGDTSSHNYVVRAINGTCYTDSNTMAGTDANGTPSAPVITSIVDNDSGAHTGITIYYTAGSPSTQHDLYRDGVLVASNFASGSTYSGGDCDVTYTYTIVAVNGSCSTSSAGVQGKDGCAPPPEIATGTNYTWTASQTSQTIGWNSAPTATGYRVYRGTKAQLPNLLNTNQNFCTRYDGTNLSLDITSDNPATIDSTYRVVYYLIVAYNDAGNGPAGNATSGPRTVNTTGDCP